MNRYILTEETLREFHDRQLERWPLAARNFEALGRVETRSVEVDGFEFLLQHNPERIRSTATRTSAADVAARACFLCAMNRPAEQLRIQFMDKYELLVNPYPIFPLHFTIPSLHHEPQLIAPTYGNHIGDLLLAARRLPGMGVFYNGPLCGASAPDHLHFQAVEAERIPLLKVVEDNPGAIPFEVKYILADSLADATEQFGTIVEQLKGRGENFDLEEPRMNVIATYAGGEYRAVVIPRKAHRPRFFGVNGPGDSCLKGEGKFLLSPASVDLGGVIVVPSPDDFRRITADTVSRMLDQTVYR